MFMSGLSSFVCVRARSDAAEVKENPADMNIEHIVA